MALAPDDLSTSAAYGAPSYAGSGQAVVADDNRTHIMNRVSWGAIFAGVAVTLFTLLLLNVLGVGIGLSALDAINASNNPDAGNASMTAGIWFGVSLIVASFFGAAAAGRLCGTSQVNTARWHGFTSWATTALVLVVLLSSGVGSLIGGTFNVLGSAVGGVGKAASSAVSSAVGGGDGLTNQVKGLVNPNDQQNAQDDVTAYVQASLNGDTKAADAAREKAVNDVAKAANISPDEARKKIDQVVTSTKQTVAEAKDKAAQAAEATRKAVSQGSLFLVGGLFLAGLAGWLGGGAGRPHRETSLVVPTSGRTLN